MLCHLLPAWRDKTSYGQFTCHQTDGTRGLRLRGQLVGLAETSSLDSGGKGGGIFFLLCGCLKNLPLLPSEDQLSATVTKTPCTNSALNSATPNLDAEGHTDKLDIISVFAFHVLFISITPSYLDCISLAPLYCSFPQ